jgi:serine/threonine protein kinase
MRFESGARLGPYAIIAPLGAGGMGEVYKARDVRLDRVVALKVLPRDAAADPDLRARFDREARAISALDHPNICALFDVGREEGTGFLVMQFLESETLAERLSRGRLPLEEGMALAIQIADALNCAHSAGIVHRDLKPSNVMLTKSGGTRHAPQQAKLLDFGIARSDLGPAFAISLGEADDATRLSATTQGKKTDLFALERATRKAVEVAVTPFDETCGAFSPDVRSVAYTSNVTGSPEVYVRPFPQAGPPVRVSSAGGSQPRWRHDGRELFYVSLDGRMMAVALRESHDRLDVSAAVPLFQAGKISGYDVSPDGRRFLLNHARVDARTLPAVVLLNWAAPLPLGR